MRDEASGTESLPQLVEEMRGKLAGDYPTLSHFETAVYTAGYDDRLASEYAKVVLRVRDEALHRVSETFPRLVPGSIVGGLPAGVSAVNYELRVDAAAAWMVAKTPAAAEMLLADFTK